jgi:hypothetical protein
MRPIAFNCDRCDKEVKGFYTESATAGYYSVGKGRAWEPYGREGEIYVCDACVHAMPEYKAAYGEGESQELQGL